MSIPAVYCAFIQSRRSLSRSPTCHKHFGMAHPFFPCIMQESKKRVYPVCNVPSESSTGHNYTGYYYICHNYTGHNYITSTEVCTQSAQSLQNCPWYQGAYRASGPGSHGGIQLVVPRLKAEGYPPAGSIPNVLCAERSINCHAHTCAQLPVCVRLLARRPS